MEEWQVFFTVSQYLKIMQEKSSKAEIKLIQLIEHFNEIKCKSQKQKKNLLEVQYLRHE